MSSVMPMLLTALALITLLVISTGCQRSGASGPATPQPSENAASHQEDHGSAHEADHETAGEHAHGHGHGHGQPDVALPADFTGPSRLALDPDLRALLIEEMVQIERGMQELLSSLSRGERERAAELAGRVRDSFVLARQLTDDQRARLIESLPPELVALDRQFHTRAGNLAEAAKAGDMAEAARVYGQMTEDCVSCHTAFARERFPGLR